ncbi:MAG: hypothetical protein PHI37_00375 [Candidatus Gracilibacteria bacterium]|nr:hypothetical protein [Candidatus Gracilibacteria bacterium]
MDFNKIKSKIIETKNKAVIKSADLLSNSLFTIKTNEELKKTIEKSKKTIFTNKETGETKEFNKKVIIIFGDEESDFFKDSLINFPVLATKAFSQNIALKLAKIKIEGLNLEDYNIKDIPSLVVFENEKVIKVISGRENILKLVKSIKLDINKEIEKF